ncbi:MAG: N-acetyl-gamma-glutamyl-phosphate reductase [Patescibacteria group bacterium]
MSGIKVGIVGGAGYVGGELLRLIQAHPAAELAAVCSRSHAGKPLGAAWPQFRQIGDLAFAAAEPEAALREAEVVFLAMGQGEALSLAPSLLSAGKRVIDLGPDFRFGETGIYEQWYGRAHTCPSAAAGAAYGLTELFRDEIRGARLVGNPGCYPTAVLLALAPLAREGLIGPRSLVISAVSGLSGAGRSPAEGGLLAEASDNVRAYGLPAHRHLPEIEQGLRRLSGGRLGEVCFVPHLAPMARGLHVTAVADLAVPRLQTADVLAAMARFYSAEPFVAVLGQDALPETKAVLGTNRAQVTARVDPRTGRVVALAAIDNLGKGAAGQAVQNMNLMLGLDETAGLTATAVYP